MKKNKKIEPKKYELKFEHDDCTTIWKYDASKTTTGPYEVEIKYKKVPKK